MADNKITVGIDLEDDLSPKIDQLKTKLESVSKTIPQAAAPEGGGGGFRKTAEDVGFLGKQLEELKAGIGYTVGAWNLGFAAADMAVGAVSSALKAVKEDYDVYTQLAARLEGSNVDAGASFTHLADAAYNSGQTIKETFKDVDKLMAGGFSMDVATDMAEALGERSKRTGVDLIDTAAKANLLRATPEEIAGAARAGGPYAALEAPAQEAMRKETAREFDKYQVDLARTSEQRIFEDKTHDAQRVFEMQTMLANKEMNDRQRDQRELMEDTHFRLNDEMEMTDRAINREMEQRHRVNQQTRQDTEETTSRATSIASGIKGVMQAAVTGDYSQVSSLALPAVRAIKEQLPAAYEQLQKDLGIGPVGAKYLIQTGQMSPSVLLEEAQRNRALKDRKAERDEEKESWNEHNRQQDYAHDQSKQFHYEDIDLSREQQRERETHEWDTAATRMERTEDVYQHQKQFERDYQDFLIQQQGEATKDRIKGNRDYLQAAAEDTKKKLMEPVTAVPGGAELMPTYVRPGAAKEAEAVGAATEKTMSEATEYLKKIQEKLDRVLSGG